MQSLSSTFANSICRHTVRVRRRNDAASSSVWRRRRCGCCSSVMVSSSCSSFPKLDLVVLDKTWRCNTAGLFQGDAQLEAEIVKFMDGSRNPNMFPTEEELRKAGREDLAAAIRKRGGWFSLGWGEVNGNAVTHDGAPPPSLAGGVSSDEIGSDTSLEIGADDEDSGILGILNRLEKQRKNGHGARSRQKIPDEDDDEITESASSSMGEDESTASNGFTTSEPEHWRRSFKVENERSNSHELITVATSEEENARTTDKYRIQDRLQQLSYELNAALQSLRSKRAEYITEQVNFQVAENASDTEKVSDAWEFKETDLLNSRERLRSIRAKIAVLEGKMALATIDAQRRLDVNKKRIEDVNKALKNLRTKCVVWTGSASEVLLSGSFDGWTTKRKMKRSKIGMFCLDLKLYPGNYEIKFIVDGVWRVDPLRPVVNNNGYHNNIFSVS